LADDGQQEAIEGEPVAAEGQAVVEGAQPEPQPAVVEEELDPDVRQAVEMGLDPDFVRSLPPDMRRELISNESFRAANTGAPQPAPVREPEAMDVASIIATVQDPQLRREMLQNLSQEQIDSLPANLRTEAMNLLRGRPAGGAFARPDALLGQMPRPPPRRAVEELMHGRYGDDLERQMDLFMDRIRGEAHRAGVGAHKKVLPDPRMLPFDHLLVEWTSELDLKLQDEQPSLIAKIQEQTERSSEGT